MIYRATVVPTKDHGNHLLLILVEAPKGELSSRSVIEGAVMGYTDPNQLWSVLAPLAQKAGEDMAEFQAKFQAAQWEPGETIVAGLFELSPADLMALGFKTLAAMAQYANAMDPAITRGEHR